MVPGLLVIKIQEIIIIILQCMKQCAFYGVDMERSIMSTVRTLVVVYYVINNRIMRHKRL